MRLGSLALKTPFLRSRASLSRVTRADHLRGDLRRAVFLPAVLFLLAVFLRACLAMAALLQQANVRRNAGVPAAHEFFRSFRSLCGALSQTVAPGLRISFDLRILGTVGAVSGLLYVGLA